MVESYNVVPIDTFEVVDDQSGLGDCDPVVSEHPAQAVRACSVEHRVLAQLIEVGEEEMPRPVRCVVVNDVAAVDISSAGGSAPTWVAGHH